MFAHPLLPACYCWHMPPCFGCLPARYCLPATAVRVLPYFGRCLLATAWLRTLLLFCAPVRALVLCCAAQFNINGSSALSLAQQLAPALLWRKDAGRLGGLSNMSLPSFAVGPRGSWLGSGAPRRPEQHVAA